MLKILLLTLFSFAPADSLRTETVNGTWFIIHQVSGGETLYAIARRYKTSVDGIKKANENTEAGIKEGQILRIPFDKKVKKPASVQVKEKEIEKKTHTVAAKETLSAIAKKFGLSIKQLKELNALQSDQVKIGQVLLVSGNKPTVAEKKEVKQEIVVEKKIERKETKQSAEKPVVAEKKQVKEAVKPAEKKEELIKISETVADSDEMKEVGTAEIMEGTDGTRKYLAIHRNIKVGSIVKVRNDATNKEVFVRVSGSMPAGVDEKTVIKISRAAFERLGGTDSSLQAEVTYYK